VRDRDDDTVCRQLHKHLFDALRRADPGLAIGLATAAHDVDPGLPGSVLVGEALARLRTGQSLPEPQVQLTQPWVQAQVDPGGGGERQRGVPGAAQVAGQQDGRPRRRQERGDRRRLLTPDDVQRGVELALDASEGVVTGPAVPQQDDPPASGGQAGQGATWLRPTERSASRSTKGITGQSFHSRSRA